MLKIILKIYRVVLIILALIFLGWLLNKNIVPQGQLQIETDFYDESNFISELYPKERVGADKDKEGGQIIFIEPAYFKVKVPRTFDRVKIKMVYQNKEQELLQMGLLKKRTDPLDWRFSLKPLENQALDNLDWFKLTEQGISLWQKNKKFDSIYDFVNNLPAGKIITFFYAFSPEAFEKEQETIIKEWSPELSLSEADYVIANYVSPQTISLKGDKEQILEFWAGQEHLNENAYEFMISAPGLEDYRRQIKIKEVLINLDRPTTTWSDFWFDLKSYILRKYEHLWEKIS
jgi:hypothetical protein